MDPRLPADPLQHLLDLPGVAGAVGEARDAVDRLLTNRALRRRSGEVSAESSLRGVWASAWLSGTHRDLEQVRAGAAAADPVLQGALRVYAAIPTVTDTWSRAPMQVLARLHALAAADLVTDTATLGRPVAGAQISQRLAALAQVLAGTAAPAPVLAAVVHGELLALDAFAPSSGVVARAAARLTLIGRGLDPRSLVVLEVGHRELEAQYRDALAGYATGTAHGVTGWIRHCCAAIVGGAQEATAICEALARG